MSSKRAIRRRACDGKTRYGTYGTAVLAMKALIRAHGNEGWPLQTYKCRFCGGFHFGHVPVNLLKARKAA